MVDRWDRAGSVRLVRFLPRGGAFRDVVALDAEVDPAGRVRTLSLGLDRRFVEEPVDGRWARDIAQTFLRAAVPGFPADVLALADEIGQGGSERPEPSDAALAFLGLRAESELVTPAATVTLRNLVVEGEGWLILTAAVTDAR